MDLPPRLGGARPLAPGPRLRRRPPGQQHPPQGDAPGRRAAGGAAAEAGIDAVNLHYSDWSGGKTVLFHRFGRYTFGWDAQHERIIRDLVRMGIDGVFSDHVDRLVDGMGLVT